MTTLETFRSTLEDESSTEGALEQKYRSLREANPEQNSDLAVVLVEKVTDSSSGNRLFASRLLRDLAAHEPHSVAPHVDALVEVAATDEIVADKSVETVKYVARVDPDAVLVHRHGIATLLRADLPRVRDAAIDILVLLSTTRSEDLADVVRTMVEIASEPMPAAPPSGPMSSTRRIHQTQTIARDQLRQAWRTDHAVREGAIIFLSNVVAVDPDAVEPHVPTLFELARSPSALEPVRTRALNVVFDVALERPNARFDLEGLCTLLTDTDGPDLRAMAALVLSAIADERKAAVASAVDRPAVDATLELLESGESAHREAASSLCFPLVSRISDASERIQSSLLNALEDESRVVRGNAIWALSHSLGMSVDDRGSEAIVDALYIISKTDESPDIRALAEAVLEEHGR